jgi:hypothetical protein
MSLSHYFPRDKLVMGVSSRGYHPEGGVILSRVSSNQRCHILDVSW